MSAPSGRNRLFIIIGAAVLGALAVSVVGGRKDSSKADVKATATSSVSTAAVATGDSTSSSAVSIDPNAPVGREPAELQTVEIVGETLATHDQKAATDLAVGKAAAKIVGYGLDGRPQTIDPADGKPKMVVFLAHWCPHCQREAPLITQWQKEGKLPADVTIYAVSTAVDKNGNNYPPSAWLKKIEWPNPVLADDSKRTAASTYGLSGFPFMVALRADGTVAARASGEKELEEFVALLNKAKG
jgi:cytochrome c biogenesis protein CcmG, thiol:disulfide interchange protein DsbE